MSTLTYPRNLSSIAQIPMEKKGACQNENENKEKIKAKKKNKNITQRIPKNRERTVMQKKPTNSIDLDQFP